MTDEKTAQDLADSLYEWIDPNLVVCTAAAVYDFKTERWELAKRNLHGD